MENRTQTHGAKGVGVRQKDLVREGSEKVVDGQGSENPMKGNRWLRLMRAQKAWKAELFNMERLHLLFRRMADSLGDCSLF